MQQFHRVIFASSFLWNAHYLHQASFVAKKRFSTDNTVFLTTQENSSVYKSFGETNRIVTVENLNSVNRPDNNAIHKELRIQFHL